MQSYKRSSIKGIIADNNIQENVDINIIKGILSIIFIIFIVIINIKWPNERGRQQKHLQRC